MGLGGSAAGDAVSGLHSEDGLASGVTCVARFPNSDAVDAHVRGKLVAFGDDFGKVNIAAFPCQMDQETVGCDRSVAHNGPVGCLAFTYEGSLLVSVGSDDGCLLIWRVVPVPLQSSGFSENLLSILSKYDRDDWREEGRRTGGSEEGNELALVPQYAEFLVCRPEQSKLEPRAGYGSLPREQLKLVHCYSYRGWDTRGNLGVLRQSGHLVYFAAALAIVHNPETNTQKFFTKHRSNISCLALHPTQDLVATGDLGAHSCIWVWDAGALTYHLDTMDWEAAAPVLLTGDMRGGAGALCFCDVTAAGSKLACVGLDGRLVIYNWKLGSKVTEVLTEVEQGR